MATAVATQTETSGAMESKEKNKTKLTFDVLSEELKGMIVDRVYLSANASRRCKGEEG